MSRHFLDVRLVAKGGKIQDHRKRSRRDQPIWLKVARSDREYERETEVGRLRETKRRWTETETVKDSQTKLYSTTVHDRGAE